MDRRASLSAVTGGLLAAPRPAKAQQAEKVYRVGYLVSGFRSGSAGMLVAFGQGRRELGGHGLIWRSQIGYAISFEMTQRLLPESPGVDR